MDKIIKPKKGLLLYNDINWNDMPFPKKWYDGVLSDKIDKPHGYLKVTAFDHSKQMKPGDMSLFTEGGKKIYEDGGENQIMYWLKRAYSMLEGGVFFSDTGEHKGYIDGGESTVNESGMSPAWRYFDDSGEYVYLTHTWKTSTDALAVNVDDIPDDTLLFPFFPTKMRFGTQGPTDITTPIDPSETSLEDPNSQGPGEYGTVTKNNFIMISRTQHIAFTTTGYSTSSPGGYYADFGSVFKNITVYQVTMPASAVSYIYDGKQLNEAGLFNDASLSGTVGGLYDQPSGMLLAKRYFSPIQKTNTISINWQWSIVK